MLTDYQIKENMQKIKWHLYKRNQRTRGLEKKDDELEEKRIRIRVIKQAI